MNNYNLNSFIDIAESKVRPHTEQSKQKSKEKKDSIIFTLGDGKTVEVPLDAKFKHVADGKEVELTLADARNGAAGEKSIASRLAELGNEKNRALTMQRSAEALKDYAREIVEAIKSGDIEGLAIAAAKISEEESSSISDMLIEAAKGYGEKFSSMDDKDRKILDLERQNRSLLDKSKAASDSMEATGRKQRVGQLVQETFDNFGISKDDYLEAEKMLKQMDADGKLQDWQKQALGIDLNSASDQEVATKIRYIAGTASNQNKINAITGFIEELRPGLKDSDPSLYNEVLEDAFYSHFDPNPRKRMDSVDKLKEFVQSRVGEKPEAHQQKKQEDSLAASREDVSVEVTSTKRNQGEGVDSLFDEGEWNPFSKTSPKANLVI